MSFTLPGSRALSWRLLLALAVVATAAACANKPDAAAVYWQERLAAIVASPDRSAPDDAPRRAGQAATAALQLP